MRSSPTLLPIPVRRRTSLVVAAAGVVALGLLAFPFSPKAIHGLPDHRPATAVQKQAVPDSEGHPASAALRPASPASSGLAENSWDFNAPDGVPGFGPLDPAEAGRLAKMLLER
jgi:hypothetical protein